MIIETTETGDRLTDLLHLIRGNQPFDAKEYAETLSPTERDRFWIDIAHLTTTGLFIETVDIKSDPLEQLGFNVISLNNLSIRKAEEVE
jgi:hypothetical protein